MTCRQSLPAFFISSSGFIMSRGKWWLGAVTERMPTLASTARLVAPRRLNIVDGRVAIGQDKLILKSLHVDITLCFRRQQDPPTVLVLFPRSPDFGVSAHNLASA